MSETRPIRYAVVGLGHIAQAAVLPAFRSAHNSELAALVSGDATKLATLSKKYQVPLTVGYEGYEDLLHSGKVDAVYITLPNSLHEEYAVRAARAGVHVLCEKPLAVTPAACQRIIRTAHDANVKLMVAYRLHFDPTNLGAMQTVRSGRIGEPRYITSEFGYELRQGNIRALPVEGGSPLHDLGIYCINAARYLFQDEPRYVFATGLTHSPKGPRNLIQTVAATLIFPHDRVATFTCSFDSAPMSNFRVVGTQGDLFIENAYEYVGKTTQRLTTHEKKHTRTSSPGDQFAAELDYFSDCILLNREVEPSGEHGLADVQIIEALLESIETGRLVSLEGALPLTVRRPTVSQMIRKPPHREPKLVKVHAASK